MAVSKKANEVILAINKAKYTIVSTLKPEILDRTRGEMSEALINDDQLICHPCTSIFSDLNVGGQPFGNWQILK